MSIQAMGAHGRAVMEFEESPGVENGEHKKGVKINFISANVQAQQNQNTSNVITGNRNPSEPYRGNIDVQGDVEVPLDTAQIGMFLKAAFGAPETSSSGGDKYKHVFKLSQDMPSFTWEQGFQDIGVYKKYIGCKISKLSFSFGGDNELTAQTTIMGVKEVDGEGSSMQADAPTLVGNKLQFDQVTFKEDGSESNLGTDFSLDIDFGLDGDTYAIGGKGYRSFINDGITTVTGSLKAFFVDNTVIEKAEKGTPTKLEIAITNSEESLTIILPEVVYQRNTPGISGPEGVYIEMDYGAFYKDNENETAVQIELVNKIASYDIPAVESASMMSSQKLM